MLKPDFDSAPTTVRIHQIPGDSKARLDDSNSGSDGNFSRDTLSVQTTLRVRSKWFRQIADRDFGHELPFDFRRNFLLNKPHYRCRSASPRFVVLAGAQRPRAVSVLSSGRLASGKRTRPSRLKVTLHRSTLPLTIARRAHAKGHERRIYTRQFDTVP